MQRTEERTIQVEGRDDTKTERWERDCHVQGKEKNLRNWRIIKKGMSDLNVVGMEGNCQIMGN